MYALCPCTPCALILHAFVICCMACSCCLHAAMTQWGPRKLCTACLPASNVILKRRAQLGHLVKTAAQLDSKRCVLMPGQSSVLQMLLTQLLESNPSSTERVYAAWSSHVQGLQQVSAGPLLGLRFRLWTLAHTLGWTTNQPGLAGTVESCLVLSCRSTWC